MKGPFDLILISYIYKYTKSSNVSLGVYLFVLMSDHYHEPIFLKFLRELDITIAMFLA